MIHDDNRSRAVEQTHHSIARCEPEHIVGDLENDAGTFDADVVLGVGVQPSAIRTSRKFTPLQRRPRRTWPGSRGALGFGPRAQGKVPRVQRAVAEGGKPPGARLDKFSALDSLGAHQPRGKAHAVTERELRFVAADHFGDRNIGAGPVIDVGQQDAPRVLGLGAPQQPPDGRLAEIGDVFG